MNLMRRLLLLVAIPAMSFPTKPACADFVHVDVDGSLSLRAGADAAGLDGATFSFDIDFADGAIWSETGAGTLAITPTSVTLSTSGAGAAASFTHIPLFGLYYVFDNATGHAGLSERLDRVSDFSIDLQDPLSGERLFMDFMLEPTAPPSHGSLLGPQHVGAFNASASGPFAVVGTTFAQYDIENPSVSVTTTVSETPIAPQPTSLTLFGLGVVGIGLASRGRGLQWPKRPAGVQGRLANRGASRKVER